MLRQGTFNRWYRIIPAACVWEKENDGLSSVEKYTMRNRLFGLLLLGAIVVGFVVAGGRDVQAQKAKGAQPTFEIFQDKSKEYRFRLVLGDEKLAISSRGYKSKAEILKVIDSVKKEASKAKVVDQLKK